MGTKTNIFWSADDKEGVILKARELYDAGEIKGWSRIIMAAQYQVLPKEKHKSDTAINGRTIVEFKAAALALIIGDSVSNTSASKNEEQLSIPGTETVTSIETVVSKRKYTKKLVIWTTEEYNLVLEALRKDKKDMSKANIATVIFNAQKTVLVKARNKTFSNIVESDLCANMLRAATSKADVFPSKVVVVPPEDVRNYTNSGVSSIPTGVISVANVIPVVKEEKKPDLVTEQVNIPFMPQIPIPAIDFDGIIAAHIAKHVGDFVLKYRGQLEVKIEAAIEVAYNDFVSEIDGEIKEEVEKRFQQKLKAITPAKTKHIHKFKVMIIGLHSDQEHLIKKEYGDHLKLVFVHTDAPARAVIDVKDSCDFVLMMTKFINHNKFEIAKDHKALRMVNGGMTDLKNVLLELSCA